MSRIPIIFVCNHRVCILPDTFIGTETMSYSEKHFNNTTSDIIEVVTKDAHTSVHPVDISKLFEYDENLFFYKNIVTVIRLTDKLTLDRILATESVSELPAAEYILFNTLTTSNNSDNTGVSKPVTPASGIKNLFGKQPKKQLTIAPTVIPAANTDTSSSDSPATFSIPTSVLESSTSDIIKYLTSNSPVQTSYYPTLSLPRTISRQMATQIISFLLDINESEIILLFRHPSTAFVHEYSVDASHTTIGDTTDIIAILPEKYHGTEFVPDRILSELSEPLTIISQISSFTPSISKLFVNEITILAKYRATTAPVYHSGVLKTKSSSTPSLNTPSNATTTVANYSYGYKQIISGSDISLSTSLNLIHDQSIFDIIRFLYFDYSDLNVIKIECQPTSSTFETNSCITRVFADIDQKSAFQNTIINRETVSIFTNFNTNIIIDEDIINITRINVHSNGDVEFVFNIPGSVQYSHAIVDTFVSYIKSHYEYLFHKFYLDSAIANLTFSISNYEILLHEFSANIMTPIHVYSDTMQKFQALTRFSAYNEVYSTKTTLKCNLLQYTTANNLNKQALCMKQTILTPTMSRYISYPTLYIKSDSTIDISITGASSLYDVYVNILLLTSTLINNDPVKKSAANKPASNTSPSQSTDIKYYQKKYADTGKKVIAQLQKTDPIMFGTVRIGNEDIIYTRYVQRVYQRPHVITDNDYEIISTLNPEAVVRVTNQTYPDKHVNLFCSFEEHSIVNFKHVNGKCVPFCSSRKIYSDSYNTCVQLLNAETYERKQSYVKPNSDYNPNIPVERHCDIPDELSKLCPNQRLYRVNVKSVEQFIEDLAGYGFRLILLYRSGVSEDDVQYNIASIYIEKQNHVLAIIDERFPGNILLLMQYGNTSNSNESLPYSVLVNRRKYVPVIIEENIVLKKTIRESIALNHTIISFYNNIRYIIRVVDPKSELIEIDTINTKLIFVTKNHIIVGFIYKMYFLPTIPVKYSSTIKQKMKFNKQILQELRFRYGLVGIDQLETRVFEHNPTMRSWSEDGILKLPMLSMFTPKYIKQYFVDYDTNKVIAIFYNDVFVPVIDDIEHKNMKSVVYADKRGMLLNYTHNVINRHEMKNKNDYTDHMKLFIEELLLLYIKNNMKCNQLNDFEKIYNITADDLISLCQYMGVIGEETKIAYIKKSQRVSIRNSVVRAEDIRIYFVQNDYNLHSNIMLMNRSLNYINNNVFKFNIPGTIVYEKRLYNYAGY